MCDVQNVVELATCLELGLQRRSVVAHVPKAGVAYFADLQGVEPAVKRQIGDFRGKCACQLCADESSWWLRDAVLHHLGCSVALINNWNAVPATESCSGSRLGSCVTGWSCQEI